MNELGWPLPVQMSSVLPAAPPPSAQPESTPPLWMVSAPARWDSASARSSIPGTVAVQMSPEPPWCLFQPPAAPSQTHGQVPDPADLPAELVHAPAHGEAKDQLATAGAGPGRHGDRPVPGVGGSGRWAAWVSEGSRGESSGPAWISSRLHHASLGSASSNGAVVSASLNRVL